MEMRLPVLLVNSMSIESVMPFNHHSLSLAHGETVETVADFILGGGVPKSLQILTATMKLKDTYSLEGKL